jgi:nucleoside-diphosphate-sugar epimerase
MPISVVTGGAGFVGQALVRRMLAGGDTVRAIVLRGDPWVDELRQTARPAERLEIVEGDVTDYGSIAPAFEGASRAFHTAALIHAWAPWRRFRAVNVGGMQNVARAAREAGVERFVFVSTSDVFGLPIGRQVIDEAWPFRRWNEPYADTKIEAESWLWRFHRESGLPVSVIYPGWVYGPGDHAFFPSLAAAIRRKEMMFWSHGARLAWVHVDNLADACILASTHPDAVGEGFLVHDDSLGPTLEEVCARIAAAIGAPTPTRHIPYWFAYALAATAQRAWRVLSLRGTPPLLTVDVKAFGKQWYLSTAKVRRVLGWSPQVAVAEGMEQALEYLERMVALEHRRVPGAER